MHSMPALRWHRFLPSYSYLRIARLLNSVPPLSRLQTARFHSIPSWRVSAEFLETCSSPHLLFNKDWNAKDMSIRYAQYCTSTVNTVKSNLIIYLDGLSRLEAKVGRLLVAVFFSFILLNFGSYYNNAFGAVSTKRNDSCEKE